LGAILGGLKLKNFKPLSHSVLKFEPKLLEFIESFSSEYRRTKKFIWRIKKFNPNEKNPK
jgi:hypothetical protein